MIQGDSREGVSFIEKITDDSGKKGYFIFHDII